MHAYINVYNPKAADRFVLDLYAKMQQVAGLGLTGVRQQDTGSEVRILPYRDRIIHFRVSSSHIRVLRILHGRQDISSDDFPESEI